MCGLYDPIAQTKRPFRRPSDEVKNSAGKSGVVDGVQQKMASAFRTASLRSLSDSTKSLLKAENLTFLRQLVFSGS